MGDDFPFATDLSARFALFHKRFRYGATGHGKPDSAGRGASVIPRAGVTLAGAGWGSRQSRGQRGATHRHRSHR